MAKSAFDDFIQEEINKQKGVALPVKASLFERLFIKKLSYKLLHPNPEDEFTFPSIGPNYEIISNYEKAIRDNIRNRLPIFEEPLMVEKLHPHGYMILKSIRLGIPALFYNLSKNGYDIRFYSSE